MKNSGIGGQAIMEGVMMKNKEKYAMSVRLSDGSIVTEVKEYRSITEKHKWLGIPFIRGSVNFVESMIVGMRSLTWSADFFDDETDEKQKKDKGDVKENEGFLTGWVLFGTVALSLLLALGLFMFLPQLISEGVCSLLSLKVGGRLCVAIEGLLRLVIFILYVYLISFMNDIKRTYMYHGAEHKSINCLEHGLDLTVENVRKSSKEHKRCGTSFMIIVLVIAVFVTMLIPPVTAFNPVVNFLLRFAIRIALLPVIAGIAYEFLRLAGRSDNPIINVLSRPGMWMQAMTTKEPDDSMIEVAIASVEAVFDWRDFLDSNFPERNSSVNSEGKTD